MKSLKLKKLVAVAIAFMTIASISPIGASAAWKQDSTGWWNTEGSSYSTGWKAIDGSWYDFDSTGYMKTGWVNDGGTWYFTNASGAMKTGWINDRGTWYFTNASGAMQTGWVNDGGTWYFTASSGAMQTGVIEIDGKIYDFVASGAMATGSVVIDGVTYTFAASGEAIGDKIPTPTKAFSGTGISVTPTKTPTDTSTTGSTGSSSGGGGGGSSSHHHTAPTAEEIKQAAIDNQYKAEVTIGMETPIIDGDVTIIKPILAFTPGTKTTATINGVDYTVKKDLYVTLDDGTDVGIDGTSFLTDGKYEVPTGKSGTISAIISLIDANGTLYYVTPVPVQFK